MFPQKWPKTAFIASDPVLDFLNTVDAQGRSADQNRLLSYGSLIAWGKAAGLIDPNEEREIADAFSSAPAESEQALYDLLQWREAVYRVFETIAKNEKPPANDWLTVEAWIKKAISSARLSRDKNGATCWKTPPGTIDLTTIPHRLALGLHELLAGSLFTNLKQCEGCTWLFIDTSKNHTRRWCSMATCGNRAKAQRHYQTTALP
jgi:predicted RNA-binding Zn ribbon-like protein